MPRALSQSLSHETVIALNQPRAEIADAEPAFLRRRNLNSSLVIETLHANLAGFGALGAVQHVAKHTPSVRVRKSRIKIAGNPQAYHLVESVDIDDNVERLADRREIGKDLIWLGLLVRGNRQIHDDR